nr:hypothetical protein DMDDKFKA_00011 [Haslea ostrearia]
MIALLYYSYSTNLTEDEIVEIDKKVLRNRELVYVFLTKLSSNTKRKTKRVIIVVCLGFVLVFSNIQSVEAIGLSLPPTPVVKVQPNYKHTYKMKVAPTVNPRLDKILMLSTNRMIPLIYLNSHYCYINDHSLKKLRAGDLSGTLTVVTIGVVVYLICQLSGVDAFVILRELGTLNAPTVVEFNPTYAQPSSRTVPGSALEINRPTAMPHQEFVGLTKEERRQLPHPYDKIIHVEGHPRLRVGFWQSRYKVAKHGAVHGLPYSLKNNGKTKTEISDDTALAMMQSIEDMPYRPNAIWFDQDDVTYQGGTDRGFPAVHIFDDDTKVIAVFNKQTGNFVTTCQLEEKEEIELKAIHNFGGTEGWSSGKVNNLPPKGITPKNSFENDVMGIRPVDDSQINNSNN